MGGGGINDSLLLKTVQVSMSPTTKPKLQMLVKALVRKAVEISTKAAIDLKVEIYRNCRCFALKLFICFPKSWLFVFVLTFLKSYLPPTSISSGIV